jgi:hypothetical protein
VTVLRGDAAALVALPRQLLQPEKIDAGMPHWVALFN